METAPGKYRACRVYFPHGWAPEINVDGVFHLIQKVVFHAPETAIMFAELWNEGAPGECEEFARQYSNLEDC